MESLIVLVSEMKRQTANNWSLLNKSINGEDVQHCAGENFEVECKCKEGFYMSNNKCVGNLKLAIYQIKMSRKFRFYLHF